MDGRSGWGVMVVAEACGWVGRREEKERGRSVLCGHGWCVWEGEGGKKEGREGGREGEGASDGIEHQSSHKQSFFSGLARHFHRIRFCFEMLPLVQTLSRLQ